MPAKKPVEEEPTGPVFHPIEVTITDTTPPAVTEVTVTPPPVSAEPETQPAHHRPAVKE